MVEDKGAFLGKLQEVLDKVAQALEDGCAEVQKIRSGTVDRLKIVRQEFEEIQSKMEVTIAEYETTQRAYAAARRRLVEATKCKDEAAEWQAYHEAEYLLQQKGRLEEREAHLRRRRDDLEREIARLEETLRQSDQMLHKLELALQLLLSQADDISSLLEGADFKALAIALELIERERRRLARDLHDGPIQECASLLLSLELVDRFCAEGKFDEVVNCLKEAKVQLRSTMTSMRNFIQGLKTLEPEDTLEGAIRNLARRVETTYGIPVKVSFEGKMPSLRKILLVHLFHIIQEATINAARHARAKEIKIMVSGGEDALRVKVVDDGMGFDVKKALGAAEREAWGLRSMLDRAQILGGEISIESAPSRGTIVTLVVPL